MNFIAIIEQDIILFFRENNENIEFISKEYLFFYYDTITKKIKNHLNYKIFALENNQFTYSDIINKISENKAFTIDNRTLGYEFFISLIFEKIIKPNQNIEIIFADTIPETAKTKIVNYLKDKFQITVLPEKLSYYTAKNHIQKKQITTNSDFTVLTYLGENINIAEAKYSDNTLYINNVSVIKTHSLSPETYAVAENIVTDIKRVYNKNIDDETAIEYLSVKLFDKTPQISNFPQDFVVISTRLHDTPERYTVRLDKNKLKLSKQVFLKNIVNNLQKHANITETTSLITCGDLFNENIKYFASYFSNIDNYQLSEILRQRNNQLTANTDDFATMFMTNDEITEQEKQSEQISTLNIDKLENGVEIKLTNYDPRPGKGYSTQIIEYLGDNRFVVIESTRSLRTGDLLETKDQVWHPGIKIIFDVYRNGKLYGRFQTREIQTIEIISEKK